MTTAGRPGEAPAPAANEDVERALALAEGLRREIEVLEEQRSILGANRAEIQRARSTLDTLREAKPGDVLLLPLGAGTFTRAGIVDATKILAAVGSGVHVEGSLDDAVKILEARAEATDRAIERISSESERLQRDLAKVARGLQGIDGG